MTSTTSNVGAVGSRHKYAHVRHGRARERDATKAHWSSNLALKFSAAVFALDCDANDSPDDATFGRCWP